MGAYDSNNVYKPEDRERDWGSKVNDNFQILSDLLTKSNSISDDINDLNDDISNLNLKDDDIISKINSIKSKISDLEQENLELNESLQTLGTDITNFRNYIANISENFRDVNDLMSSNKSELLSKITTNTDNINTINSNLSLTNTNISKNSNLINDLDKRIQQLESVPAFTYKIVETLPAKGEESVIYFVPKEVGVVGYNIYDEYIWIGDSFELIGDTESKITNFYTKDVSDNTFVNVTTNQTINGSKKFTQTIKGNIETANKLKTQISINDTNFDGSKDITTNIWGISRDFYITDGANTGTSTQINGSKDISLFLPKTINANINGTSTNSKNDDNGNYIPTTYATKDENETNLNTSKNYTDSSIHSLETTLNSNCVHKTDNETINGTKTFTSEIKGTITTISQKVNSTEKTHTNFGTNGLFVPTMDFISFWNGAYNSSNSSNLTYCAQGTIIGSNNIGSQSVNYSNSTGSVEWSNVQNKPSTFTPSSHTHDDRYYTESEIDTKLGGKSDTSHTHDDRYYTESEIDTKLSSKSDTTHNHNSVYLGISAKAESSKSADSVAWNNVSGKPTSFTPSSHNHDDRYYTETEVNNLLGGKSDTTHNHNSVYLGISAKAESSKSADSVAWNNVSGKPSTYTPSSHTHDDRYYTETEVNNLLSSKSDTTHTHSNYLTGITKAMVTNALGYTPPTSDTNTTYSAGTNLSLSGTTFNVSSTPSFTNITLNGYTITVD